MDLKTLGAHWHRYGEVDPLWAILMVPDRKDGRWDKREFFEKGQIEIRYTMDQIGKLRFPLRRARALDFGCGVGRLTQAMACYFDHVDSVDIAPSMIQQARQLNPYGDRCRFHVNTRDDLRLFRDNQFDFIFSLIVLQHMQPDYVRNYVAEFMRILAPGGLAVFQMPSHPSRKPLHEAYEPLWIRVRRRARWVARTQRDRVWRKILGRSYEAPFDFGSISQMSHTRLDPIVDATTTTRIDGPHRLTSQSEPTAEAEKPEFVAEPRCEVYSIHRRDMLAYIRSHGGRLIDIRERGDCSPLIHSYRYYVTK